MKPPYRVPLLSEINAAPRNGLVVASTFSGGGGSSTGYKMAGYDVVYANEFVESARETYSANHRTTILDGRDIREVTGESILKMTGLKKGDLDLLDGSPPCSAFSTAGKRSDGWGKSKKYSDDKDQVIEDLFFEYSRLVRELLPKVFVAENVSGLIKGVAKGYFKRILADLQGSGYSVSARLLNARWLGVPQARERIIFIGVRDDLEISPSILFPKPLPYSYTIEEALEGVDPTVEPESWMTGHATGREYMKLVRGGQSEKYFQLVRPFYNRVCPTITAAGGNAGLASVAHPQQCRKFSIAELKRICSFPDDYIFAGSYAQQYERMGRSVPPVMMSHIASAIAKEILGHE